MELVIKVVITVGVIWFSAKTLHWTWTSQIDPKATLRKFMDEKPKISSTLVAREVNKIYQNGKVVADVTGSVEIKDGVCVFSQLINVSGADMSQPFEYQRSKFRIQKIQKTIGQKVFASSAGTTVLNNVMEGVTCIEVN